MGIKFQLTVDSLDSLAVYIEQRAEERKQQADAARLVRDQQIWRAEAYGLKMAADIIRDTIIDPSVADKKAKAG